MNRALACGLIVLSALSIPTPSPAALGEVTITSALVITDRIGEVRGRVDLGGEKGALVTVTNGRAAYTTATDASGAFSVVLALRSNRVEATARSLDGSAGTPAGGRAEAVIGSREPTLGPAPAELYGLCQGLLTGGIPVSVPAVRRLSELMDASILHAGGWEFDERMVLLMLGCLSRIVEQTRTADLAGRASLEEHLGRLGRTLYRAVVRGMDGQPLDPTHPAPARRP